MTSRTHRSGLFEAREEIGVEIAALGDQRQPPVAPRLARGVVAADEVALAHHADDAGLLVHHRHGADAALQEEARGIAQLHVGRHGRDLGGHDRASFDCHGGDDSAPRGIPPLTWRKGPRPMTRRMIVLFTDFGLAGPYTGQVKAVLRAKRRACRSSISSPTRRRRTRARPHIFSPPMPRGFRRAPCSCASSIPASDRRARRWPRSIDGRWYVGPDNGLFELVLRRARRCAAVGDHVAARSLVGELSRPRPVRAGGGAPRARRGAGLGRAAGRLGAPAGLARRSRRDRLCRSLRQRHDRACARRLSRRAARLVACGRAIARARTFSDVPPGAAFWYENSNGLAEIAVNLGRADETLGLRVGSAIAVDS